MLAVLLSSVGCLGGKYLIASVAAHGDARVLPNRLRQPVRPDARLAVLWVGHATALVQLDDRLVLTDPVFTDTIGQLSPRLVEPGVSVSDLPAVDAALISHLHFDHLSLGSLEELEPKLRWLGMPRGGLTYLTDFRFPAEEVPWWESRTLPGGMRVTAVPAQHDGWRYGLDRAWRKAGFTGWVVEHRGLTVYYSGDTGLSVPVFRAVAARFPSIDVALLPIGPIHPRDFHREVHLDPEEALTAFELLGARWMVPVHFDTFVQAVDEVGEAKAALLHAMQERGVDEGRVVLLEIGEQHVFIPR